MPKTGKGQLLEESHGTAALFVANDPRRLGTFGGNQEGLQGKRYAANNVATAHPQQYPSVGRPLFGVKNHADNAGRAPDAQETGKYGDQVESNLLGLGKGRDTLRVGLIAWVGWWFEEQEIVHS